MRKRSFPSIDDAKKKRGYASHRVQVSSSQSVLEYIHIFHARTTFNYTNYTWYNYQKYLTTDIVTCHQATIYYPEVALHVPARPNQKCRSVSLVSNMNKYFLVALKYYEPTTSIPNADRYVHMA